MIGKELLMFLMRARKSRQTGKPYHTERQNKSQKPVSFARVCLQNQVGSAARENRMNTVMCYFSFHHIFPLLKISAKNENLPSNRDNEKGCFEFRESFSEFLLFE